MMISRFIDIEWCVLRRPLQIPDCRVSPDAQPLDHCRQASGNNDDDDNQYHQRYAAILKPHFIRLRPHSYLLQLESKESNRNDIYYFTYNYAP
jgi:hypothetical protein